MTANVVLPELKAIPRRLRLSPMLDTLPERVALARQRKMPPQDFLELVLSDEVTRRDSKSAIVRAQRANLDPTMVLDAWMTHPASPSIATCGQSPPRCGF